MKCLVIERINFTLACADVPAGVGDDPDGGEDVDVVDGRLLRLRHVQDDEEDEDLVSSVAEWSDTHRVMQRFKRISWSAIAVKHFGTVNGKNVYNVYHNFIPKTAVFMCF